LAGIGVGGVGFGQLQSCDKAGFQIIALCDVDDAHAKKAFDRWPQARRYRDFRDMLQAEGDKIDSVYCGTPDHSHAVITLAALRRKKHICCVKPLTRTVQELGVVVEAARQAGVATQVTASPNTNEVACRTCELIWAGAIGDVREVLVWSDRPIWPQGMDRPAGADPIPKSLDWDLWLGPAPQRPFKSVWPDGSLELKQVGHSPKAVYHPFNFRGWWDFGTGALGDMGCHHLNTPFRALKLKHPASISASSTRCLKETAPLGSIVTYDFPAREGLPPVRVVWYDGGLMPPYPVELGGKPLGDQGVLYVGTEGKILDGVILDAARAKRFEATPKSLARRSGTWSEWYEACRGGEPAGCNFEWAGPLTRFVLLGNIALRTGKRLAWDGDRGRFTNQESANAYLQESYRSGWSL
jgi:predicted dehydrogenase